jgi:phage host-nuclease inhibitor protein Gam
MAVKAKAAKKEIKNVNLETAQDSSREYANCVISIDKIEAEINRKISNIRDQYKDQITALQESAKEHKEILEVFASEQKANWGKKKSFDLLHCTIAFKTNPPKVGKHKKFTWEAVTELLKKQNVFSRFLRQTTEINKEAILAEKNEAVLNMLKEDCYIVIEQDERFEVDVKKDVLNIG